jgi:[ribosomal protein S5]-alanine N-acetyltransferase
VLDVPRIDAGPLHRFARDGCRQLRRRNVLQTSAVTSDCGPSSAQDDDAAFCHAPCDRENGALVADAARLAAPAEACDGLIREMKVTMLTARPMLETARLTVRLADVDDVHAVIDYDRRNRDHLRAWEPVRDAAAAFDVDVRSASLEGRRADAQEGRGYLFLARVHGDDAVAASINLSNVVRGAFQACTLGYSVDAAREGQGVASEAVGAVVGFAFETLRLHRVMANYQPTNERSGKLLRRLGFVTEGYARDYLFINGAWRDHVLTALTSPHPVEMKPA